MSRRAQELIASLLADPQGFDGSGAPHSLLEEYFEGFQLKTLSPLLRHSDYFVRRSAIWVASELGVQASPLLSDVLRVLESDDRFLAYHALEVTAVCAVGPESLHFSKVLDGLEVSDDVLRVLAMGLIGNTGAGGMREILQSIDVEKWDERHVAYLRRLVSTGRADRRTVAEAMLGSPVALERKYGAILARWAVPEEPELVLAATDSDDDDVRRYAESVVRIHQLR